MIRSEQGRSVYLAHIVPGKTIENVVSQLAWIRFHGSVDLACTPCHRHLDGGVSGRRRYVLMACALRTQPTLFGCSRPTDSAHRIKTGHVAEVFLAGLLPSTADCSLHTLGHLPGISPQLRGRGLSGRRMADSFRGIWRYVRCREMEFRRPDRRSRILPRHRRGNGDGASRRRPAIYCRHGEILAWKDIVVSTARRPDNLSRGGTGEFLGSGNLQSLGFRLTYSSRSAR